MPQTAREIAKERAARLRARGDEALRAHLTQEVGRERMALVENPATGRTEGFALVKFARPAETGSVIPVTIAGHDGEKLLAA
jgi:threonylcarbamoyladenosine tRNA methylthiotransferase MtaB